MYIQRTVIGGFITYLYWSSSEYDAQFALAQSFGDDSQGEFGKVVPNHVRAVRAF